MAVSGSVWSVQRSTQTGEHDMTDIEHITAADPRCKEYQGGFSDYGYGILLADRHEENVRGNFVVGPVKRDNPRDEHECYADVHWLHWRPRVGGKKVYGVRMWLTKERAFAEDGW